MMLYYGIDIISNKLIYKGLGIQQLLHFDKAELILNPILNAVFRKVTAEDHVSPKNFEFDNS